MVHSKQQIEFSTRELELIQDNELFPLKFRTVKKISGLFQLLELSLKDKAINSQFPFPDLCEKQSGKISVGENLEGFPWLVLDYPRYFHQHDFLIFRTQCWFGHGFSFSLIGKGRPLEIISALDVPGFQLAVNEHIWNCDPTSNIWLPPNTLPRGFEAVRLMKDLETTHPVQAMQGAEKAFEDILSGYK
jgi:hypothetical protein